MISLDYRDVDDAIEAGATLDDIHANTSPLEPPPLAADESAPAPADADAPPGAADGTRGPRRHKARKAPEVAELWEKQLTIGERGGYTDSAGNIQLILANRPEWAGRLRYDERAGVVMLATGSPISDCAELCELRDRHQTQIAIWLERSDYKLKVSPSSAALSGAIQVVAELHAYDPVRDYLNSLEWDGQERLDRLMGDYFGAKTNGSGAERETQTRYHEQAGAKLMIAAVARTYDPGCKVDSALVLRGKQGVGKSTGLRALAGDQHFSDGLPDLKSKDAADYVQGAWIVELSELDSLSRADLSTVKAFLSRTHDRYRAAYARRTETHARRCVFSGTTNEDTFLRDSTGARRFWPVEVTAVDVEAIKRDRDQLWAEAVHRYRAGEPWHFVDQTVIAASVEAQQQHAVIDVWQPAIEAWISAQPRVAIAEVLEKAIGMELSKCGQAEQNRVARVLQQLGWARRRVRVGNKSPWLYFAPSEISDV